MLDRIEELIDFCAIEFPVMARPQIPGQGTGPETHPDEPADGHPLGFPQPPNLAVAALM